MCQSLLAIPVGLGSKYFWHFVTGQLGNWHLCICVQSRGIGLYAFACTIQNVRRFGCSHSMESGNCAQNPIWQVFCKAGRCYTCLKKHHLSKDCRSRLRCEKCKGIDHATICLGNARRGTNPPIPSPRVSNQGRLSKPESGTGHAPTTRNSLYLGTKTPVLLQTARLRLVNPRSESHCTVSRAVLDSGSQQAYVTSRL